MKWLKKRFLQLSIHRQLQFGIISVSSFVCFLVLVLITINIFILLNSSYNDLVIILDNKENQHIEAISNDLAISVNIVTETSKNGVQYIRNLVENLKRNNDFIRMFDNIDMISVLKPYNNKGYPDCDSSIEKSRNCIIYMKFSETDDPLFKQYTKIISLTFPLVNISLDYRFYEFKEQPIYNNIIFLSQTFQTSFTFPNKNINSDFNKSDLSRLISGHSKATQIYQEHFEIMKTSKIMVNLKLPKISFIESLQYSPVISTFSMIDSFNEPFIKKNDFYLNTYSNKYQITNINNPTINNSIIIDIVSADWDSNIIDNYSFYNDGYYRGVKSIITPYKDGFYENFLVTNAPCLYFLKFYKIQNNIFNEEYKLPFKNFTSCIEYDKGKYFINQFFYGSNGNAYDPQYVKRKANLPLINGYMDSSEGNALNFKVFEYIIPDSFQQGLLKSNFFTISKYKHFLTKNTQFFQIYRNYVFYKMVGSFFKIMFYNNILWILILVLIYFLLFQVTRNITGPINKISEIVTSLGRETNEEEPSLIIDENFTYSDDKDINELFVICKKIIKGGFSDDYINSNSTSNENLYYITFSNNNISYIKTNNLIIDEVKIEEATNASALALLNYAKKEELYKESNNDILEKSDTEKSKLKKVKTISTRRNINIDENQILKYCEYIISSIDIKSKNYLYQYLDNSNIRLMNANI